MFWRSSEKYRLYKRHVPDKKQSTVISPVCRVESCYQKKQQNEIWVKFPERGVLIPFHTQILKKFTSHYILYMWTTDSVMNSQITFLLLLFSRITDLFLPLSHVTHKLFATLGNHMHLYNNWWPQDLLKLP